MKKRNKKTKRIKTIKWNKKTSWGDTKFDKLSAKAYRKYGDKELKDGTWWYNKVKQPKYEIEFLSKYKSGRSIKTKLAYTQKESMEIIDKVLNDKFMNRWDSPGTKSVVKLWKLSDVNGKRKKTIVKRMPIRVKKNFYVK